MRRLLERTKRSKIVTWGLGFKPVVPLQLKHAHKYRLCSPALCADVMLCIFTLASDNNPSSSGQPWLLLNEPHDASLLCAPAMPHLLCIIVFLFAVL